MVDLLNSIEDTVSYGKSMEIMKRRLEKSRGEEEMWCDELKEEIRRYDHDLLKVRARVRDAIKDITETCQPEELEAIRVRMECTQKERKKELERMRAEVRESVKIRSELQAYGERYKRVEAMLKRMYDPTVATPRRMAVQGSLEASEAKFEKLINSLGDSVRRGA